MSAQLFVHTRSVELGKRWRLDSGSKLPQVLVLTDTDRKSLCRMSFTNPQMPNFAGKACHLEHLAEHWQQASSPQGSNSLQTMLLDVTDFSEKKVPPKMQDLSQDDARQHELAILIVDELGDEVRVVLLGTLNRWSGRRY